MELCIVGVEERGTGHVGPNSFGAVLKPDSNSSTSTYSDLKIFYHLRVNEIRLTSGFSSNGRAAFLDNVIRAATAARR